LKLLADPDFRAREGAKYRLSKHPLPVIAAIVETIKTANVDVARQQIELLDFFACMSNVEASVAAYNELERLSLAKGTSKGYLAEKCISTLRNAKEKSAIENLEFTGIHVGDTELSINGSSKNLVRAVVIDSTRFNGNKEALNWLQFVQSVDTASLKGPLIDVGVLAAIAKMPSIKKILIRDPNLRPEDLLLLRSIAELQHLELSYWNGGDQFVPVLAQLPITESLRLFGTDISDDADQRLRKQLDGLEIYRGSGGFLGIASGNRGAVQVTELVRGGAAEKAGLQVGDVILQINGSTIKNMEELRRLLARHRASESVKVRIRRISQELDVDVILSEQQQ
jgi:PDZ domain